MGIILVACVFITRRIDFSSKNTGFNEMFTVDDI